MMGTHGTLCIIMARGGSKRIPQKNIRAFCGRPMVSWPIRAAQQANLFSSIIISTEDAEIAEVAQQYGASVPFVRPAELADDFSTTADVVNHALHEVQKTQKCLPKYCCCLYGTSALVTPKWLQQGLEQMQQTKCEFVMAVSEYGHPVERSVQFNEDGTILYRQPEFVSLRTQDIRPSYHDLGLLYWFSPRAFLQHGGKSFLPLTKSAIVVPRTAAVDIDNNEDWIFAEQMAKVQGLK